MIRSLYYNGNTDGVGVITTSQAYTAKLLNTYFSINLTGFTTYKELTIATAMDSSLIWDYMCCEICSP